MKLAGLVWNRLDRADRAYLISQAYPERSVGLVAYEAKMKWQKLLPSTQDALTDIDWAMALGREIDHD